MPLFKYDGAAAAETAAPATNFYGSDGAETRTGTAAAEGLWGGRGDRLGGGGGNDTYYLQARDVAVVEVAGGGTDKIVAWHNVTLADHPDVENLSVSGDNIYGAGNAVDNIVQGGSGAQQIYGGLGQDVLSGGAGKDIFIVYKGEGNDVIHDFKAAEDVVRLKAGFTGFAQVQARLIQAGADVKLDLGGGDGLIFRNMTVDQFTESNFQLELDVGALGAPSFSDEFSGPVSIWDKESNPSGTWRPDYGYQGAQGYGSYTLASNGEKQIYTSPYFRDRAGDFAETPFVSNADGTLSIWARPSTNPEIFGYGYSSGMITTRPSFAQTYGYFEIRADVPDGAGLWPAFWLLPTDWSWPPELDVMEILGNDTRAAWTTSHTAVDGHAATGKLSFVPETSGGMHTYGALWTPTDLVWYVDGVEVFRTATPADMNKPMFMIANLALGGWAGDVAAGAVPAEFRIDYIRAYELPTEIEAPPISPPPPPPPPAPSGGGAGTPVPPAAETGKVIAGAVGGETLAGGSGDDVVNAVGGGNYLRGAGGNDRINGGDGFDDINGNMGDDTLTGGLGADWVVGGKDNDLLGGDHGDDIVLGNLGADWCDAGAGNDVVRGGQADDVLLGQEGDDWMSGDLGSDTLIGGVGADTFHTFAEAGLDRIEDFNAAEGDRVNLLPGAVYSLRQSGGDAVIDLGGDNRMVLANVDLSSLPAGWIFGA